VKLILATEGPYPKYYADLVHRPTRKNSSHHQDKSLEKKYTEITTLVDKLKLKSHILDLKFIEVYVSKCCKIKLVLLVLTINTDSGIEGGKWVYNHVANHQSLFG